MVRDEDVSLSRLIDIINERFGSELMEADQLFFEQLAEAAVSDDALRRAAESNPADKFQLVFREALESLFIERMDLNEELFTNYMSNPELQDVVSKQLGDQIYINGSRILPTSRMALRLLETQGTDSLTSRHAACKPMPLRAP